jgi:hypothetical protein
LYGADNLSNLRSIRAAATQPLARLARHRANMTGIPSFTRLRPRGSLPRAAVDLLLRAAAIAALAVGILVVLPELVKAAA